MQEDGYNEWVRTVLEWIKWLDLIMFSVLLGLFLYVFTSCSITKLHRIYLLLHMVFMIWTLLQFASQTTTLYQYKLLYLSGSYVGLSLLGIGWLVFTLLLSGHSYVIRISRLAMLSLPALVSVIVVIWNPNRQFLLLDLGLDPIRQLQSGPLYWLMIAQLFLYVSVSFVIVLYRLSKEVSPKHRTMMKTAANGMFVLLLFSIADLFINVIFVEHFTHYIPLISVGMAFAAIYIVYAISRNKVFDIIQIVQRDVMNTMSMGIIVLDENDIVIEVNKVIKTFIRLRNGQLFDPAAITTQFKPVTAKEFQVFFEEQHQRPHDRLELELTLEIDQLRYVIVQSAPIVDRKKKIVGRVLTFQDVTELRRLVEETNTQNELLHERNRDLLIVQDELHQANKKLEYMAITDGLTGCFNRRYLLQQLEKEVVTNIRYGIPFSIFIFDLDHFKSINDQYGHLVGDEVLISTVDAVRRSLQQTDVLARFGGEEFTVYLPHTNREQADLIAEAIKETVEQNHVRTGAGEQTVAVTISMGVITIDQYAAMDDLTDTKAFLRELIAQADAALYEAKYGGRNRIVKRKLA